MRRGTKDREDHGNAQAPRRSEEREANLGTRDANRRPGRNWALWASVVCSLLFVWARVFYRSLEDALPFIGYFIAFTAFVLLLGVLAWTLVVGLIGLRGRRPASLLPFAIALSTLAAMYLLPIGRWLVDYDFRAGLSAREEVVSAIESGRLQDAGLVVTGSYPQTGTDLIRLPEKYSHLSRGRGEVVVLRDDGTLTVLFYYAYPDFEGHFTGFVYSSSGPVPVDRVPYRNVKRIRRLQDHWYWVSSWYDYGRSSTPTTD